MSEKDNGGPAFPSENPAEFVSGMSLRDYFAGKALQGFISGGGVEWLGFHPSYNNHADIAAECFKFADAMLAERAK